MSAAEVMPANWSAPAVPQRWEYHVAHFTGDAIGVKWHEIQATLNAAGWDGWELVNADVDRNQRNMGAPVTVTCFLKRQRTA